MLRLRWSRGHSLHLIYSCGKLHGASGECQSDVQYVWAITFFKQTGVDEENEKAANRRSGQCPRKSEQLHPGVEGLWRTETAVQRQRRTPPQLTGTHWLIFCCPCKSARILYVQNPHLLVQFRFDTEGWDSELIKNKNIKKQKKKIRALASPPARQSATKQ